VIGEGKTLYEKATAHAKKSRANVQTRSGERPFPDAMWEAAPPRAGVFGTERGINVREGKFRESVQRQTP